MKRLTIILILLILIPLSVEALYVNDEQGNRKTCVDISEGSWAYWEWHNYIITYNDAAGNPLPPEYYLVVDSTGYPKPMYEEKEISPYGYEKDYGPTEYSKDIETYKKQFKLTVPDGYYLYSSFMGDVRLSIDGAAKKMAEQQFYKDHFVPTDDCIPCTERGLTENYGECLTCYEANGEWSPFFSYDPDKIVQGKKGYYGCFPCPEGTKWDGKECAIPTTAPPTTTPTPTTTPAPTTVPPTKTTTPTTTPPPKCPEHMKLEGIHCVERCPSTSLEDYRSWDPELKKCVDPGDCIIKKPDAPPLTGNGCGSGWNEKFIPDAYPPSPIPSFGIGFSFLSACNTHDVCYGTCNVGQETCDNQFLTNMRSECDSWINRLKSKAIFSWLPGPVFAVPRLGCKATAKAYYKVVDTVGYNPYKDAQDEFCIDKCTSPE